MSAAVMTTRYVYLDPQPGGVPPTLHLKPGTTGTRLQICVRTQNSHGNGYTVSSGRRAVLKGKRPDGAEVFITSTTGYSSGGREANIIFSSEAHLRMLTAVPGTYILELSIYDTASSVTKNNEANFDRLTTARFYLCVDKRA